MFTSEYKTRVRYADTDQMGYVYYGNYTVFYEMGRVESLRDLGVRYKDLEEKENVMMPVLDCTMKYLKPAKYDDLVTIRTKIPEMPSIKIKFEYEILSEEGELLNSGTTTLVFINKNTHRPVRIPQVIQEVLQPYFEN